LASQGYRGVEANTALTGVTGILDTTENLASLARLGSKAITALTGFLEPRVNVELTDATVGTVVQVMRGKRDLTGLWDPEVPEDPTDGKGPKVYRGIPESQGRTESWAGKGHTGRQGEMVCQESVAHRGSQDRADGQERMAEGGHHRRFLGRQAKQVPEEVQERGETVVFLESLAILGNLARWVLEVPRGITDIPG